MERYPDIFPETFTVSDFLEIEYETEVSSLSLIETIRSGITKQSVLDLANLYDMSIPEISKLLPVTERTIQRKSPSEVMRPEVAEHIIELANLAIYGVAVLGNRTAFLSWVNTPLLALNNLKPISILDTIHGIGLVKDILGRIEYGVFS